MGTATINIQVNFQQLKAAVKQLTPKEKLEISDLLWEDDIAVADDTEIPLETQKLVLDRIAAGIKDPTRLLDWDEVSKTL